jgi:hypothetical protein
MFLLVISRINNMPIVKHHKHEILAFRNKVPSFKVPILLLKKISFLNIIAEKRFKYHRPNICRGQRKILEERLIYIYIYISHDRRVFRSTHG